MKETRSTNVNFSYKIKFCSTALNVIDYSKIMKGALFGNIQYIDVIINGAPILYSMRIT